MKSLLFLLFINVLFIPIGLAQVHPDKITIVIHGGAGTISRENMTIEQEKAYKLGLQTALELGYAVLQEGGSSIDAVKAAIVSMENNPLFNAGKGAVFTNDGKNELDASIMDGKTRKAGAVAGVTNVKNPILAAEAVMNKSSHVMMAGTGAEKFAKNQGLDIVDPSYFYTEKRYQGLIKAKEQERIQLDHSEDPKPRIKKSPKTGYQPNHDLIFTEGHKFGTVGCVALDRLGNLAAGTSTGGMTNKRYGRVGDAPIIGAGTYADNETCAISATGHGEFFIRNVVAYDISALMKYKGLGVQEAAQEVVMRKLAQQGGDGGVIALDRNGLISMPFNTSGMYRAYKNGSGKSEILIYKD
jgi:beta-aspartyl-peptidase (threonine type)